jgi:hypothetical protein
MLRNIDGANLRGGLLLWLVPVHHRDWTAASRFLFIALYTLHVQNKQIGSKIAKTDNKSRSENVLA